MKYRIYPIKTHTHTHTHHPQDQRPEANWHLIYQLYRQKTVFIVSKGSDVFYDKLGLQFNLQIELEVSILCSAKEDDKL